LEDEVIGKAYDSWLMGRLLQYMKPFRVVVSVSLFLPLVDSLLQIIGPLITKSAVDKYLLPAKHATSIPYFDAWLSKDAKQGLTQLAGVYLSVFVLGFFFDFGQTYLMQWTG
jgi:ATP-binding cassette subfamily B multidrug efflux pump